ncbi:hypothetical protein PsYK624_138990 [Phanerochaete sordida]|uniref:Uncharacterized protein n=1 Tax=Phanerochaete sordida TaxID=48140 RepID=A0A9P3LJS1_9APHY|nr:hypothetical protein PsYK624_138990 [Phanerochaete sordida]
MCACAAYHQSLAWISGREIRTHLCMQRRSGWCCLSSPFDSPGSPSHVRGNVALSPHSPAVNKGTRMRCMRLTSSRE